MRYGNILSRRRNRNPLYGINQINNGRDTVILEVVQIKITDGNQLILYIER